MPSCLRFGRQSGWQSGWQSAWQSTPASAIGRALNAKHAICTSIHLQRRPMSRPASQTSSSPSSSSPSKPSSNVEFLYGANVVVPALEHGRRRFVRLYIKEDERFGRLRMRGDGEAVLSGRIAAGVNLSSIEHENRGLMDLAVSLANGREVPVKEAPTSQLDRLSGGRPHQGMVLATLPPRVLGLTHLGNCDLDGVDGQVDEAEHATETLGRRYEIGTTSGNHKRMRVLGSRRYPVWLMLDQIVDPQNLGAILRSAYFFGIDGVVVTERESAPFSPVSSKASAGAMEAMDLYSAANVTKFLQESALNGWQILGTDINARQRDCVHLDLVKYLPDTLSEESDSSALASPTSDTLQQDRGSPSSSRPHILRIGNAPTILVLGNEGRGMRQSVSRQCHAHVLIRQGVERRDDGRSRLDSLNVSVAAGILLHELLINT
ncbi:Alpha/beta knot methyltransferase [Entophlyctis helioformis]|nr:Alpha/beta knot methyltransferase [Entophlyctis helioformis]